MKKRIFVSHATKDQEIVSSFVDDLLIGVLQIKLSEFFYTSGLGTKIKSGEDWRNEIRRHLNEAEIIFLIISPAYKESEMCIAEMGAAWAGEARVLPLIIEPVNYKSVGVVNEPKQIEKFLDKESLARIKDILQEHFEIPAKDIKSDRWDVKVTQFIVKAQKYLKDHPYPEPVTRDGFDEARAKVAELEKSLEDIVIELGEQQDLVEKLKAAKDKAEVKAILKPKAGSDMDEFESLAAEVKTKLKRFSPIVRGFMFKSFSGKDITIDVHPYPGEIREAVANGYIRVDLEDGITEALWDDTEEMKAVYTGLVELQEFLESKPFKDFPKQFKDKYGVPLNLNNKLFWEAVFKLPVHI